MDGMANVRLLLRVGTGQYSCKCFVGSLFGWLVAWLFACLIACFKAQLVVQFVHYLFV